MRKLLGIAMLVLASVGMIGCGTRVEVPPAHVGKIMTRSGYEPGKISTSKFRLAPCFAYCDRLVLIDVSDQAYREQMTIFIPEDKLNLGVEVQITLAVNPAKVDELFNALTPSEETGSVSRITWASIYKTYAFQIVNIKTREYLSKFTIAEIASSQERVNSELSASISEALTERSPFIVRNVGVTKTMYPPIITEAQENAARRREQIQQEEAQLEISKVQLQRELQETQLKRQIELEKAQIEAKSQELQREFIDNRVLALRRIENQRMWIEKWDGTLPTTVLGGDTSTMMVLPEKESKQ